MDQQTLIRLWEEAWREGIWYTSWEKAIEMRAGQAAWTPQAGRHSVWQIVNHILFWQDYTLRSLAGDKPRRDEADRRNWETLTDVSDRAWDQTQQRFAASCHAMAEAMPPAGKG